MTSSISSNTLNPYDELQDLSAVCKSVVEDLPKSKTYLVVWSERVGKTTDEMLSSSVSFINNFVTNLISKCKCQLDLGFDAKNLDSVKRYYSVLIRENQKELEQYNGWTFKWLVSLFVPIFKMRVERENEELREVKHEIETFQKDLIKFKKLQDPNYKNRKVDFNVVVDERTYELGSIDASPIKQKDLKTRDISTHESKKNVGQLHNPDFDIEE